jgi:hypothetical protein
MPKYFIHVRNRHGIMVDEEGCDLSFDAAVEHCLGCARELVSGDALMGFIDLNQTMVLADAAGNVIREIPFCHAVTLQQGGDVATQSCSARTTSSSPDGGLQNVFTPSRTEPTNVSRLSDRRRVADRG